LLGAGFYISAVPIVRSEGRSGFHSSEGNIRYDCVLVCRKQSSLPIPASAGLDDWSSLKENILEDSIVWAKRTRQSGMPLNRVDIFTIVMGKTIQYLTQAITVHGSLPAGISMSQALKEMADLVENIGEKIIGTASSPQAYAPKTRQLTLFVMESDHSTESPTFPD
jgi:hypothetical protein